MYGLTKINFRPKKFFRPGNYLAGSCFILRTTERGEEVR